jgi:hypothetical protein
VTGKTRSSKRGGGNLVYHLLTTAVHHNNLDQNRKATGNEHDNFRSVKPEAAESLVEGAGPEAAYRDLLKAP